ncbi:DUF1868 domain-containing protein [Legionella sp. CNM-1927-20]|uniref:DUF1868 domain-containing protein n=1 Tax=Legionella sp. CNM-1927-20 TaxID=3422221 RepID=UPI00403A8CFC
MNLKKINAQGHYCNYPGITIIAKINKRDNTFWQKVYQIVSQSKLAEQYYTPLPYKSYHMTTIRLFNQAEQENANWQEFLMSYKSFFKKLFNYLQENQFCPQITLEEINISDTLHLQVSIPANQDNLILKMARQFDLSRNIQKPFHITFGYLYNNITLELKNNLQQEMSEKLNKLYKLYGRIFTLNPPSLCIYKDMTNFINWNGEDYPFLN